MVKSFDFSDTALVETCVWTVLLMRVLEYKAKVSLEGRMRR